MTKTSIHWQELRRRIDQKAKSEPTQRFWGLFTHSTKLTTLYEAYRQAKKNGGAPGIDGQSFAEGEQAGVSAFLDSIRAELLAGTYQPQPHRQGDIPKANGKMRTLQIPSIRDRVVQGALTRIREAIFEADFCPHSYGFRPKRSPHQALAGVRRSLLRRMTTVIDGDLSRTFDTIRHHVLREKIAKRVQDPQVLHRVKQVIQGAGKVGVPQGGPFSPLAANLYRNEVDGAFEAIRRKTAEGHDEAVHDHRFADAMVITVSGHARQRGWADLALQRLQEYLEPLGVELNREKTRTVNVLKGEAFSFLGVDFRRVPNRRRTGYFILMTPKQKARQAIKARIRDVVQNGGAKPAQDIVTPVNAILAGWVNYFRVGHSSRAFGEIRDDTAMKIRTLLTRRKRRQKRSIGWRRGSHEYRYGVLGLHWDWKVHPLKSGDGYR